MENLNGNAPGVNSLQPGELFDVELSKKDSSLGLSVTVLFGKVFTLSLFCSLSPPPLISQSCKLSSVLYVAWWVWFAFLTECCLIWKRLWEFSQPNSFCMLVFFFFFFKKI